MWDSQCPKKCPLELLVCLNVGGKMIWFCPQDREKGFSYSITLTLLVSFQHIYLDVFTYSHWGEILLYTRGYLNYRIFECFYFNYIKPSLCLKYLFLYKVLKPKLFIWSCYVFVLSISINFVSVGYSSDLVSAALRTLPDVTLFPSLWFLVSVLPFLVITNDLCFPCTWSLFVSFPWNALLSVCTTTAMCTHPQLCLPRKCLRSHLPFPDCHRCALCASHSISCVLVCVLSSQNRCSWVSVSI